MGNETILAACEEKLAGKNFKDEKFDIQISEAFYKGEKINDKKLAQLMKEATSINLFGKEPIKIAIKEGLISEKEIIKICGIEHAIIIKV
jgi:hypothetical protein